MHIFFKSGFFFALQLFITFIVAEATPLPVSLDKAAFYKALASSDIDAVNDMLTQLNDASVPEKWLMKVPYR